MRNNLILIILFHLVTLTSYGQSIESEITEFAKREYPNDAQMQAYVYKNQI